MYIERIVNPLTRDRHYSIMLTERDIEDVYKNMTYHEKMELEYFGRKSATIEETLMGLQVCARVLERVNTDKSDVLDSPNSVPPAEMESRPE